MKEQKEYLRLRLKKKLKKINNLIKDTFWYTVGDILTHGSALILVPIYTYLLSKEDFGIISLMILFYTASKFIISFSVKSSYYRLIFECSHQERKELTFSAFLNSSFLSFILIIFLELLKYFKLQTFGINLIYYDYLQIVFLASWLYTINEIALSLYKYYNKSKIFALVNTLRVIIEIISFYLLLNYGSDAVESKFYGLAIAFMLSISIHFLFGLKNEFVVKYNKNLSRKLLKFSIPLVINDLVGWGLVSIDQLIYQSFYGLEKLAVLALGIQVISTYKYGMEGILKAVNNKIFHTVDRLKIYANQALIFFINLFAIGGALLVIFEKQIIAILGNNKFSESVTIIHYFIIPKFLLLITTILGFYLLAQKKKKDILYATIISFITMLILSPILIPKFDVLGAATSSFVSIIARLVFMILVINKFLPLKLFVILKTLIISISVILILIIVNEYLFFQLLTFTLFLIYLFFIERDRFKLIIPKI